MTQGPKRGSLHSLDDAQQHPRPKNRSRGRSRALVAVDGWVERPSGRRRSAGRLAAGSPAAGLLPVWGWSVKENAEDRLIRYIVNGPEIYAVVDGIFLILAALDGDCVEVLAVQLFRL